MENTTSEITNAKPSKNHEAAVVAQYGFESYENEFESDMAYNDFLEEIETLIHDRKSDWFFCKVEGFGWRGTSGIKVFKADNAKEILRQILPKTDNSSKLYKIQSKAYFFALQNFHHDSATGREWYYLREATEQEIEDYGR